MDAQESAGPLPGDVIYGVNGAQVRTLTDLRSAIGQISPDSTVVLHIGRQGQLRFVTVTLE
jgi:S1-C subfamily serine protease